jgi:DNA (cytosine-5)-methyltransferase 1
LLTVGSLFSGIGGIDLGLERAGMQVRWQVEIDPYCQRVLAKHWPNVKRYGDIREVKWSEVEPVDLICGGFPCQPVSVAGARKGDKDERWLWPEFLRAICEIRPKCALVENVPGLLSTDDGRLARGVFGDLAEIGYHAEWDCISAQDVGAPHLRRRVFIVAYPQSDIWSASRHGRSLSFDRSHSLLADTDKPRRGKEPIIFAQCLHPSFSGHAGSEGVVENSRLMVGSEGAEIEGIISGCAEKRDSCGKPAGPSDSQLPDTECEGLLSEYFPQTRQIARHSGFEQQWAVEPDVGRVAYGVSSRVDRLKCLGNAVVPQVAEYIGRLIMEKVKP